MRFPWRRKPKPATGPSPLQAELHEPHEINCRYCGPVTITDPEKHLASPEHRLAQVQAIAPKVAPDPNDPPAEYMEEAPRG
jgi:hypothetical protein